MKNTNSYLDLDGNAISLTHLDAKERRLVARLRRRARAHPDWCDFDNYWMREVAAFYDARGWSRARSTETAVFQIAQDLSSRLGIKSGMVRSPDYLDELEDLIRTRFPSRRAFCKATGLSEDLLSHVLAGRKHFSVQTLTKALARIGYRLRIVPLPHRKRAG
jgi:hypothetical protein